MCFFLGRQSLLSVISFHQFWHQDIVIAIKICRYRVFADSERIRSAIPDKPILKAGAFDCRRAT